MKKIPNGRQSINEKDLLSVTQALKRDLITTGNLVDDFESKIKNYLKSKYVRVCSSGTAGLHLSLMAINVKKNDIIIMPSINFIAVYNMSKLLGARVVLADVDKNTGQMTPDTLRDCIKRNNLKKIKAIITMYLGGYPENVFEFYKIKKKYKCYLIEDACHAFGAKYSFRNKNYYVGSCEHSDFAVFSLHPLKTITSGEGGIICSKNKILDNKIKLLRSHGIKKTKNHWIYDVIYSGYNYRLSDVNCSLGISQLSKISKFLKKRSIISKYYLKNLSKHFNFPKYDKKNISSNHLFLINLNRKSLKFKNKFMSYMKKNNISLHYHYIPIFKMNKIFKNNNFDKKNFKGSIEYYNSAVSLPIYVDMTINHQDMIIKKLNNFILNKNE